MSTLGNAFKIYWYKPKVMVLGIFPGLFTFVVSIAAAWFTAVHFSSSMILFFLILATIMTFFLTWVVVASFALMPVEGFIIDSVQKFLFGAVRYPAPLSLRNLITQILWSSCVAFLGFALFLLSLVPGLFFLSILLMAVCSGITFTLPIYLRIPERNLWNLYLSRPLTHIVLGFALNLLLFVPLLNVFFLGFSQVLASIVAFSHPKLNSSHLQ